MVSWFSVLEVLLRFLLKKEKTMKAPVEILSKWKYEKKNIGWHCDKCGGDIKGNYDIVGGKIYHPQCNPKKSSSG